MDPFPELSPSELGTKEYWLSVYDREKKNFEEYGDPGEVWFGEDSEFRILRWLEKMMIPKDKSIVDIGCGNGMMLIQMRNEGFINLTGIDYCANAIELSKSVASSQSIEDIKFEGVTDKSSKLSGSDSRPHVQKKSSYKVWFNSQQKQSKFQSNHHKVADIISEKFHSHFDIALDKGTYDAISLHPDNALDKRKKYIENVAYMLNEDGLLIITSCNWTGDEIGEHFKEEFDYVETIPTPSFKFGGKVGNVVSSLVLKKKSR